MASVIGRSALVRVPRALSAAIRPSARTIINPAVSIVPRSVTSTSFCASSRLAGNASASSRMVGHAGGARWMSAKAQAQQEEEQPKWRHVRSRARRTGFIGGVLGTAIYLYCANNDWWGIFPKASAEEPSKPSKAAAAAASAAAAKVEPAEEQITPESDSKLIEERLYVLVEFLAEAQKVVSKDLALAKFPHIHDGKVEYTITPVALVDGNIGSVIDHTLLKPEATAAQIEKICQEAQQYRFAAVCVNGSRVDQVLEYFRKNADPRHQVKVAAVIGFPLGAMTSEAKMFEAIQLTEHGADELDMVINVGKLKDRDYIRVFEDIRAVVSVAHLTSNKVKVILETGALTRDEIVDACILSVLAGADFVKTSTGFGPGVATEDHVRLMKTVVGDSALVKASGGVSNYADAVKMVNAGAARIGASKGVAIVTGASSGPSSSKSY